MDLGLLLLRLTLGGLAAGHGAQGLLGWFRGGGLDGAARFLAREGYPAPRSTAAATAAAQVVAGAGLAAGALTPLAAAALAAVAVNAAAISRRHGLWAPDGGAEYPLVALAALAALALGGPGAASVDALAGWTLGGAPGRAAALLAGLAVGVAARRRRRRGGLLPLAEVTGRLGLAGRVHAGVRPIPVAAVVGSVDKPEAFDRDFRPRRSTSRDRLAAVRRAFPDGALPTIKVHEVGGRYFVEDGHHRVRLARARGAGFIDAEITRVPSPLALPADVDTADLVHTEQQRRLREDAGLRRAGLAHTLACSQPRGYAQILETVKAHRHDLMRAAGRVLPPEEVARSWHDTVFRPAVEAMRAQPLPAACGEVSDGDVFLWAYQQRRRLRVHDPSAGFAEAARAAPHQRFDRNPDRARPAHTPLPLRERERA